MQEGAVGSPDRPHRGPHERTTPLSAFVGWDWWKLNLSPDKAHEQGTNTAPWGCRCWGVTCPGTQPRGRPQPRALPAAGNTGKVAEAVSHALWCICLTLQEQEGFLPLKYTDPRDTAPLGSWSTAKRCPVGSSAIQPWPEGKHWPFQPWPFPPPWCLLQGVSFLCPSGQERLCSMGEAGVSCPQLANGEGGLTSLQPASPQLPPNFGASPLPANMD